jgi:hypothetical protein
VSPPPAPAGISPLPACSDRWMLYFTASIRTANGTAALIGMDTASGSPSQWNGRYTTQPAKLHVA